MKLRRFGLLVFASTCVQMLAAQQTDSLTSQQKAWLTKAYYHEKCGWVYLHIEGAPRERGFQHGYILAKDIEEGVRVQRKVWEYQSAREWLWLVKQATKLFATRIDSEILAELDGITEGMKAAGTPMSRDELIAYNGSPELLGSWWPSVKDSLSPYSPEWKKESCSSFIATGTMTTNGQIVLGHNTWSDYYYAVFNIILDILPENGHRILMQTSAGLVHSGTDFFLTDAGLVGSETTIGGFFPFDLNGVPEFVRMRQATQYASSIDEWCNIMKAGNNGGYANAWLVGDANTNEIARLELGLKYVGFEKKKDGYFVGSNVAEDLRILRFETKTQEQNIKNADIARRVRWKQLMKQNTGAIDIEKGKAFLGDHYDVYLETLTPDARTLCGHWELDPQTAGLDEPFLPLGAYDGKIVDSEMAKRMSFLARWGSGCGREFNAESFLEEHSQFDWMSGLIKDRPSEPWVEFRAGER